MSSSAPQLPAESFRQVPVDSYGRWTYADCSWDGSVCMAGSLTLDAYTPGPLIRSTDQGSSYSEVNGTRLGEWGGISVSANGSWVLAVLQLLRNDTGTHYGALYRSTDYGASFIEIPGTSNIYWSVVACGKASPYCIAGVYKHQPCDLTEPKGGIAHIFTGLPFFPICPAANGVATGLWRSDDYGVTFTQVKDVTSFNCVACQADGQVCVAGTANDPGKVLFRSNDYGVTWSQVFSGASIAYITSSADGVYWQASGSTEMWRSTDNGLNFNAVSGADLDNFAQSACTGSGEVCIGTWSASRNSFCSCKQDLIQF